MKKIDIIGIIMIIISVLFSLVTLITGWYKDELFDSLFFIYIILDLFIIAYNIIFLLFILIARRINKSKLILVSLIILIISLVIRFIFPFREVKTAAELYLYENKRLEIIEKIKNEELIPYEGNNVKLPKNYKKYSSSGEVYIHKNDEDGQVICFWIFRGMLSGSTKLVYSTDYKLIENSISNIESIKKLKDNWYYVITN